MRVNSDETIRRALRFRAENGDRSWLELSRDPAQQQRSRDFFSGGTQSAPSDGRPRFFGLRGNKPTR